MASGIPRYSGLGLTCRSRSHRKSKTLSLLSLSPMRITSTDVSDSVERHKSIRHDKTRSTQWIVHL